MPLWNSLATKRSSPEAKQGQKERQDDSKQVDKQVDKDNQAYELPVEQAAS